MLTIARSLQLAVSSTNLVMLSLQDIALVGRSVQLLGTSYRDVSRCFLSVNGRDVGELLLRFTAVDVS